MSTKAAGKTSCIQRQGERGHGVRCGAELTRRRANTHCHVKVSGTVSCPYST